MPKYFSKILYVLSGNRRSLISLLLVFILTSLLEALGIGLIGPFITLVSNPETIHDITLLRQIYLWLNLQSNSQFISLLCVFIIAIFCFKSVAYFLSKTYIFRYTYNQKRLIISRLLRSYLNVPYTFHLHRNTATLIKNAVIETNQFTNLCLLPFLESVANLVVVLSLLLLLANTDSLLLAMIMGVLLPTFIFLARFGKSLRNWGRTESDTQQNMIKILNHSLGGLKETRVLGRETYFEKQMDHESREFARAATLFHSFQLLPRVVVETILVVFLMLFILISQLLFQQNFQDLIAIMGVFAIAAIRLIPSTSQLMESIGKLQKGSHALDLLYLDLKELSRQHELEHRLKTHVASGADFESFSDDQEDAIAFEQCIDLEGITYRYPGITETAIDNLSLQIQKGQSVAIIGKSGAGKTTLVDVILGLLFPEQGDIKVDGVSVYDNLRSWQRLIGYIPQSIFLMDDTIEHNIAFGVPDHLIDAERLQQAIQAAQLDELIQQLPDGVKTSVGERGVRLSGGQRQRIGIARALYHEREILVLDEATSALDNETERLVSEAISSLAGTKTLIIIAHRLSTVEHCDRVYLLEQGRVARSGTYEEVVLARQA